MATCYPYTHTHTHTHTHCCLYTTFRVSHTLSCCCCFCLVTKSRLILCNDMDYSLPGSSVHGIFQSRILEWVAISFSGGSSPPCDQTCISCIGRCIFYHWAAWEAHIGTPREWQIFIIWERFNVLLSWWVIQSHVLYVRWIMKVVCTIYVCVYFMSIYVSIYKYTHKIYVYIHIYKQSVNIK